MPEQRCLLDTNVIVRYLVADNVHHARAAAKIFEACDRGQTAVIIVPCVLSECVFVLESFYKLPRHNIATVLKALISSPGVEIHDQAVHLDALTRYASSKVHFVDCTLAAIAAASGTPVLSFDQDFKKFPDIKIRNPLH